MWRTTLFLLLFLPSALWAADPAIRIAPDRPDGIYKAGETITWTIKADVSGEVDYQVFHMGIKPAASGKVTLGEGASVSFAAPEAGWYLMSLKVLKSDGKPGAYNGGALVDPQAIQGVTPAAPDFDEYWKTQLSLLAAIPMDVKDETADSGEATVEYHKISLANIGGSRVYGQWAKPQGEGPFPAIALYQYAGVYGLPRNNAVNMAKRGYLVINIMAHDLPFDGAPEFYKEKMSGPLNNYVKIGFTNRDSTYFRRMFLGTRRALDFLMAQKTWNQKVLVVSGTSQGGIQAFAAAGLCPQVTHLAVNVPAGCDLAAASGGRRNGWPYWGGNEAAVQTLVDQTASYYNPTAFAARTKAQAYVAVGYVDVTSPASHVLSTFNSLPGKKELVPMVESPHGASRGFEQKPWQEGSIRFFESLK